MERRKFLKYIGSATVGCGFSACSSNNLFDFPKRDRSSEPTQRPPANFGKLEKTNLTIGFVPVTDCAPLIIAKEKGFFQRYGLNVGLKKYPDWSAVHKDLLSWGIDACVALFGLPMLTNFGSAKAPVISLMMLNRNGAGITFSKKAWQGAIRPSTDYYNFEDFAYSYRKYIRRLTEPLKVGIDLTNSMANYTLLYWLSAMEINPEKQIKLIEFPPSQMVYKLQAGIVDGYCLDEPWNQRAVVDQAGFTVYVNRDIWKGHPGKILATMGPWAEKHPTTARALVAAVLEACQYCDQLENRQSIAQIISRSKYIDTKVKYIEGSLLGNYNYGGFDQKDRFEAIPDFNLFHFQDTDYLKKPNHANYPWRSHGVWLLTQMIRWRHINRRQYPKDADKIIDRIYPVKIYEEVAKALKIDLPSERMRVEPANVFVDQRAFDPSQPVNYLNGFDIRADRSQLFAAVN